MSFIYLFIAGVVMWGMWKTYTLTKNNNAKRAYETTTNNLIKNMRCEVCQTNELPVYRIDGNDEIITACCEDFINILHDRIVSHGDFSNNPGSNYSQANEWIPNNFKHFDLVKLNGGSLEQKLKDYEYPIVAYFVGTLESGNRYAIIVGTSDEWICVITYNRAKTPTYGDYGFSITGNRWSYGSKVLGAPQIREAIKNNLPEIKAIMATQEEVRQKKKERKELIKKRRTIVNSPTPEKEIKIPENSFFCNECNYVISKNEFGESNLFCPDCGTALEET
jgi:hypothetical protein